MTNTATPLRMRDLVEAAKTRFYDTKTVSDKTSGSTTAETAPMTIIETTEYVFDTMIRNQPKSQQRIILEELYLEAMHENLPTPIEPEGRDWLTWLDSAVISIFTEYLTDTDHKMAETSQRRWYARKY